MGYKTILTVITQPGQEELVVLPTSLITRESSGPAR